VSVGGSNQLPFLVLPKMILQSNATPWWHACLHDTRVRVQVQGVRTPTPSCQSGSVAGIDKNNSH
jgi:hypothetical protein